MTRVGRPTGLIRYSSQDAIAGKPRRLLRLRTVLYPAVLLLLLTGLATALAVKQTADLTVLRGLDGPFTTEADGRISNQIRVKLTNRQGDTRAYTITVEGLVDSVLTARDVTVIAPENPLMITGGATRTTSLFVLLPPQAFRQGERWATLRVSDGRGYQEEVQYRLLGPARTSGAQP
jgi:polyferredoxin